jgi:hypothetical protein
MSRGRPVWVPGDYRHLKLEKAVVLAGLVLDPRYSYGKESGVATNEGQWPANLTN